MDRTTQQELVTMTECYAALDYDGHTIAVCTLPAHHTEDHTDTTEDDHGQPFTITWKREPDTVIGEVVPTSTPTTPVIICTPRTDCADPHVLRWHCMRGHDGAPRGVCPLDVCEKRGANE